MSRTRTHYDVLGLKPTASDHKSELDPCTLVIIANKLSR